MHGTNKTVSKKTIRAKTIHTLSWYLYVFVHIYYDVVVVAIAVVVRFFFFFWLIESAIK